MQNQAKPLFDLYTIADTIVGRPMFVPDARATIDDDMVLTRYLDDYKFVDLIGTHSLYFTRLDFLKTMSWADEDEGRIATAHYVADVRYAEGDGTNAPTQRALYRNFLEAGPHHQAYISCWYQSANEAERMWLEYVPDGRGVAVQTTVGKLIKFFNGGDAIKQVTMAPIAYIDWDVDAMAGIEERDDSIAALKYKGRKWQHENEMRIIMWYNMFYLGSVLPPRGEHLSVSVGDLLERIIISPNAGECYTESVKRLVAKTPLESRVSHSRFAG